MNKTILFSILASGVIGYAAWQLNQGNQDGAGETRPVASPTVIETPPLATPETTIVTEQSVTPVETPPEREEEKAAVINADGPLPDVTAKYVATGKPEQIMAYYAQLRRARAELVQNQMNAETSDSQWAEDLSQRFEFARGLLPTLSGMELAQTDCRQTICALHLNVSSSDYKRYEPYMQHIGNALGADAWVHPDANPGETVVYVARAETKLPDLDLGQE